MPEVLFWSCWDFVSSFAIPLVEPFLNSLEDTDSHSKAWGGTSYAWSSVHVVGVLVVGFASLVIFVIYGQQL